MTNETDVILPRDERSAFKRTVTGWVSRDGRFYGDDERGARWSGATHVECQSCGAVIHKGRTLCAVCVDSRAVARYAAREQREWDGTQMLYSETHDRYFDSPEDAEEWAEREDMSIWLMCLVLCDPVYCPTLDPGDYATDELPEDGELPDEVVSAIAAFNAAVKGVVLSWQPGKYALAREHAEGCK